MEPPAFKQPEQLVDGPELARILGVSHSTIKRLRRRNEIPFMKLGKSKLIRYSVRDVLAVIRQAEE